MKKRNEDFEAMNEWADREVARRLNEFEKWEELKRKSIKGLRKNGSHVPNQGLRGFGGQVLQQDDNVKSAEDLGANNFAEWQDQSEGQETGYKDPDLFAEGDAYFKQGETMRPEVDDISVAKELYALLGNVLTPKQLVIYSLHIEGGNSFGEVAEKLNVSKQTVHESWGLIEQKLRTHFDRMREGRRS